MAPLDDLPSLQARATAARSRRDRLAREFDSLLVWDPDNVFWLTGQWSWRDRVWLLLDGGVWRCIAPAGISPPAGVELMAAADGDLARALAARPIARRPRRALPVDRPVAGPLAGALRHRGWIDVGGQLEEARQVKDAVEVAIISRNVAVLDRALRALGRLIRAGRSERDLWSELDRLLRAHGTEGLELTGNLASGPRTLEDDPQAGVRRLALGDLILIDAYPRMAGYYADLTRTWVCGRPDPDLERAYVAVARALETVAAAVRPGVGGRELDRVARHALAQEGYPDAYRHHTGHGFGVKQQERPWLAPESTDVLEPSMVIAVEPACYLRGVGGVRLEQDFLVTDRGALPLAGGRLSLEPET
jgi:Xaa-Pro aminopeptidase